MPTTYTPESVPTTDYNKLVPAGYGELPFGTIPSEMAVDTFGFGDPTTQHVTAESTLATVHSSAESTPATVHTGESIPSTTHTPVDA